MKLSFIITAFNRPDAPRTCLSSIVQQTYRDWEAIVVDNSEYGPAVSAQHDLCEMDMRIHYWRTTSKTQVRSSDHQHTRCLYTATELGVTKAIGDYLCFPNDDSYYCPWFAERMLEAAGRENWDLVYCDLIAGGAGGHWLMQTQPRRCQIDKTCFILRKPSFIGFTRKTGKDYPQADGLMIEELVESGIRHGRVSQCLVVHN